MTRIALITTTIHVPTVLTQWVKSGMSSDDVIIVAGDYKSPHAEIRELLSRIDDDDATPRCFYLDPKQQQHYTVSDKIRWNCIQRRNIALLEAMSMGAEYVLTIDDDNAPTHERQVERLLSIMQNDEQLTTTSTSTGWYNPGRHCLTDDLRTVVHRGFPLSQRHVRPLYTHEHIKAKIGVAAMLWTGDPDIDAIERIVNAPNVSRIDGAVVLAPNTWAPFNTQATMFRGELAPAMFMWPHVGRYDDIWASYVTRKVMDKRGLSAYYGRPAVHQARNEHNLLNDLGQELFGMNHNETVIESIRRTKLHADETILSDTAEIFGDVIGTLNLPAPTIHAMSAWVDDVEAILRG